MFLVVYIQCLYIKLVTGFGLSILVSSGLPRGGCTLGLTQYHMTFECSLEAILGCGLLSDKSTTSDGNEEHTDCFVSLV